MRNLIRQILLQEVEKRKKVLKFYAFDWDDNILFMPTLIYLVDDNGEEVGMSTHAFADYRSEIGKSEVKYKGHNIVGFAPDPFRDFGVKGNRAFVNGVDDAELGPAWGDFVEALNSGSYFAIITARGHNPEALKAGVRKLILMNRDGIDSDLIYENLVKRKIKAGEPFSKNKMEEIDRYLDKCKFYPVSFGAGSAASPEEAKKARMEDFKNYIKSQIMKLNRRLEAKGEEGYEFESVIGFSDDDPKNVKAMLQSVKDINIYSTYGGKKQLMKPEEEKLEESITRFKQLVK